MVTKGIYLAFSSLKSNLIDHNNCSKSMYKNQSEKRLMTPKLKKIDINMNRKIKRIFNLCKIRIELKILLTWIGLTFLLKFWDGEKRKNDIFTLKVDLIQTQIEKYTVIFLIKNSKQIKIAVQFIWHFCIEFCRKIQNPNYIRKKYDTIAMDFEWIYEIREIYVIHHISK